MTRAFGVGGLVVLVAWLLPYGAEAHFQVLIPAQDVVSAGDSRTIELEIAFTHPMEAGPAMEMGLPRRFGMVVADQTHDLIGMLRPRKVDGRAASGYTMHLIDGDGRDVGQSKTADDGLYSFAGLPAGSYSLGVEAPDGRVAVVDAPPVRVGRATLARRDVRLTEADPSRRDAAVEANPSFGLWWAGLSPAARAGTIAGMAFFAVITYSALDDDDDDDFREEEATPTGVP